MKISEEQRRLLLFTSVLMLTFGFLLGTLNYDHNLFSWAASETDQLTGLQQSAPERPAEAIHVAQQLETAINYAAETARPAVVSIISRSRVEQGRFPFEGFPGFDDPFFRRFFGQPFERERRERNVENLGSGVIIDSDGYILTNRHVIERADEIEVELMEGKDVAAELVASDPHSDLAVIKVELNNLPVASFANSDDVKVGQWAIAIGAPFRYRDTVNVGHVSALHRRIGIGRYEDLIQTDAAINPGNSGGPLVNIEGEVIGINTAIATAGERGNQGIGFAISSNMARRTAEDLIEHGRPRRPWLGVTIQSLTPELADYFERKEGALIAEVADGSPAQKAGLEHGDLIIKLEETPISSTDELQRRVLSYTIDQEITVTVKRDGDRRQFIVKLGEVPIDGADSLITETDQPAELGLELEEIPAEQAASEYNIDPPRTVLKITSVEHPSAASDRGFVEGDLIVEVDRQPVSSLQQFNRHIKEQQEAGRSNLLLLVRHRGGYYWRVLPIN